MEKKKNNNNNNKNPRENQYVANFICNIITPTVNMLLLSSDKVLRSANFKPQKQTGSILFTVHCAVQQQLTDPFMLHCCSLMGEGL